MVTLPKSETREDLVGADSDIERHSSYSASGEDLYKIKRIFNASLNIVRAISNYIIELNLVLSHLSEEERKK